MNDSITLGRILGIRIGAHWSLLVVFWLIAFSLADSLLPAQVARQPAAAYWGAGIVAALLFFISLLTHELAHAMVARRAGIEIEGITLWLFGGVARLRAEAAGPANELRIAVVGPAASLAVALLFQLIAIGLGAAGVPALLVAVASWLALINAILGVFNLLPALPLDGGRVLRALIWRWTGRLTRATVVAAMVGRLIAYVMIGAGIVLFFAGDVLDGLWFAFLGWFLLGAAGSEAQQRLLGDALAGVRVGDVMSRDPLVAPGWITVDEFIRSYVLTHRYSSFPVRDFEGAVAGLVTLSRLRLVPPEERTAVRAVDVAYKLADVVRAQPAEPLVDLVGRLDGHAGGRALVFDGDDLVGIVSPVDVNRAIQVAGLRTR